MYALDAVEGNESVLGETDALLKKKIHQEDFLVDKEDFWSLFDIFRSKIQDFVPKS